MWKPYLLRVIRERATNAVNILDRFHIVAKMNEALDDVRAAEARRLAQDGCQPLLKKTRWCVLKRKANLTSAQRFRLRDLLRYNLKTVRAYLLKEDFQQFWEYNSPTWAAKFLDDWKEFFYGKEKAGAVKRGFFNYYPTESVKVGAIVVATFMDPRAKMKNGEQMPYIVSGGLTALLLTIIGSTLFDAGFLADASGDRLSEDARPPR